MAAAVPYGRQAFALRYMSYVFSVVRLVFRHHILLSSSVWSVLECISDVQCCSGIESLTLILTGYASLVQKSFDLSSFLGNVMCLYA